MKAAKLNYDTYPTWKAMDSAEQCNTISKRIDQSEDSNWLNINVLSMSDVKFWIQNEMTTTAEVSGINPGSE
jgi:hypothetical protein